MAFPLTPTSVKIAISFAEFKEQRKADVDLLQRKLHDNLSKKHEKLVQRGKKECFFKRIFWKSSKISSDFIRKHRLSLL